MNKTKLKENYFSAIDNLIRVAEETSQRLMAEDRKDEAIIEKVKLNIYDIFKKMFEASEKQLLREKVPEEQGLDHFFEIYMNYFVRIPKSWHESLEQAKAHQDFEKIHLEEVKLEAMERVKALFEELWKEAH